jgi:ubiquinone/menaquinone biosynthesis C-methylase UbiE
MTQTNVKLWDKMATSYDKRFEKMYQEIFQVLIPLMEPNDEVLELGCGSGLVSFKLIPLVKKFVGSDLSKEMIQVSTQKLAQTTFTNAEFLVGDAFQMPNLGQFSKVLMINLLHVIDDPLELLNQAKPSIQSTGQLIIVSYCHGEKMSFKYKFLSSLMRLGSKLGLMSKLQRFTFAEIEQLVLDAGYKIQNKIEYRNGFPFICLQLKL